MRSRGGILWDTIRSRPSAAIGVTGLSLIIAAAVLAPWIAPYGLHEQVGPPFGPPSWQHPLGLDDGGVDMVTLLMWGARISLVVGFAATLVSMLIGGTIGVAAGYFGGKVDGVLMRITDYFLVIPDVPLMIVVAAIWGPSLFHIVIVIGILLWTSTARVIRAQVKSVRERVYVKRARALGAEPFPHRPAARPAAGRAALDRQHGADDRGGGVRRDRARVSRARRPESDLARQGDRERVLSAPRSRLEPGGRSFRLGSSSRC